MANTATKNNNEYMSVEDLRGMQMDVHCMFKLNLWFCVAREPRSFSEPVIMTREVSVIRTADGYIFEFVCCKQCYKEHLPYRMTHGSFVDSTTGKIKMAFNTTLESWRFGIDGDEYHQYMVHMIVDPLNTETL